VLGRLPDRSVAVHFFERPEIGHVVLLSWWRLVGRRCEATDRG
jgi:hypothetical protein